MPLYLKSPAQASTEQAGVSLYMCINRRIDHVCFRVTVALALAFGAAQLNAQIGGTGSIQGTVADPSGAAIPGATVTATNVATNTKTVQQTTEAGFYSIAALPAGQYTVN